MSQNQRHVIFGTGPLALAVMQALHRRELPLRMVNRSGNRPDGSPPDVEVVAGDAYQRDVTRALCADAAVVYQCAQPAYHEWETKFMPLQEAILDGAAANGARLVVAENTYMYGDTDGAPLREDLPYRAHTRKGRARAAMSEALFSAHRAGRVQVATARGSDFFGPGVRGSAVGERVFAPAVEGKKAQFTGKLDVPHTMTYIGDFGETMAVLGEREEAPGRAWHVPNDRPRITQRQFGELVFAAAGHPPKIGAMGPWMMRIGGLFIPEARETVEMMYEFQKPFVVDSSDFEATFGMRPTPMEEAVAATVDWYRAQSL